MGLRFTCLRDASWRFTPDYCREVTVATLVDDIVGSLPLAASSTLRSLMPWGEPEKDNPAPQTRMIPARAYRDGALQHVASDLPGRAGLRPSHARDSQIAIRAAGRGGPGPYPATLDRVLEQDAIIDRGMRSRTLKAPWVEVLRDSQHDDPSRDARHLPTADSWAPAPSRWNRRSAGLVQSW